MLTLQPLNIVLEKAQIGRSGSQAQRVTSSSSQPTPQARSVQPSFDLIGGDDSVASPPVRPSTTEPPAAQRQAPPTKTQQPSQLLGGFDFLGAPPDRPSSASSKPAGLSRPDLKQSILSLYSTPKLQSQPVPQQQHGRQPSFGGMQAPSGGSSSAFGGFDDAFRGLSFGATSSASSNSLVQKPAQPPHQLSSQRVTPFPGLNPTSPPAKSPPALPQMTSPPQILDPPPLAGGGFFDAGPKLPSKPAPAKASQGPPPLAVRKASNASEGFGEFSSAFNPSVPSTAPITASSIANSSNGLLDITNPPSAINSARPANPSQPNRSVFNLSAPKGPSNYNAIMQSSAPATKTSFNSSSTEPWSSNAWSSNEPSVATPQTGFSVASPSLKSATGSDFGWGSSTLQTNNATPQAPQNDWSKPSTTTAQTHWTSSGSSAANDAGGWGDPTPPATTSGSLGGLGSAPAPPKVAPEEDFGDWGSAPTASSSAALPAASTIPSFGAPTQPPKANNDDLWGNVWE